MQEVDIEKDYPTDILGTLKMNFGCWAHAEQCHYMVILLYVHLWYLPTIIRTCGFKLRLCKSGFTV